ncbi:general substrate transporter [Mycena floridula]|nr:general substrate transporter [Mycena floridula]
MTSKMFKNVRVYWLAFVVYWGIFLFGYSGGIAAGVVNNPYFIQQFNLLNADGTRNINKYNTVASDVVSVLQAGAMVGALGSAPLSAKFGRKYTLFGFNLIFIFGVILCTIADGSSTGLAKIYAGRVISGIGIGAMSAVAPSFVSECAPKSVRGRITGCFQVALTLGLMLTFFVNYGVSIHIVQGFKIWRIPFGIQLLPSGVMALGLLTVNESPRFLASIGQSKQALQNLAFLRREPVTSEAVVREMAEIEAAIREEGKFQGRREAWKEAFLGKGNFPRFVIGFTIFLLQQWGGQNSVNHYAPQIFASIGYTGTKNSLLASGVYGIMKVFSTAGFVFFGIESLGRKRPLLVSALGMGTCFFIIGAILKTLPPSTTNVVSPAPGSRAMAAMLYLHVCFYSMGWGPVPWVYAGDIFPTRTRHHAFALISAWQSLWNFVVTKQTPQMSTNLGYKLFLMFGAVNIGAMAMFSLIIPETKGRSLEEMDVLFGSVTAEQRDARIKIEQKELGDRTVHQESVPEVNYDKV